MPNVNRLLRLSIEVVFILAGAFLLWVAWAGRYFFDPRRTSWLALSVALVVWGFRTWQRTRNDPVSRWRAASQIGAASLALVGLLMLSLAWAPFRWVHWLLGVAGAVFVFRGLVASALLAKRS